MMMIMMSTPGSMRLMKGSSLDTKKKKVSLITKQHPLSKGAPYRRQKNRYIDPSIGKYPYC